MKSKEDQLISAQVVLNEASAADPQAVMDEFARAGFTVGPLFANSFAISAPSGEFEKYFGVGLTVSAQEGVQVKAKGKAGGKKAGAKGRAAAAAAAASSSDLPVGALPSGVKDQVESILFSRPPDFGLGGSY